MVDLPFNLDRSREIAVSTCVHKSSNRLCERPFTGVFFSQRPAKNAENRLLVGMCTLRPRKIIPQECFEFVMPRTADVSLLNVLFSLSS